METCRIPLGFLGNVAGKGYLNCYPIRPGTPLEAFPESFPKEKYVGTAGQIVGNPRLALGCVGIYRIP